MRPLEDGELRKLASRILQVHDIAYDYQWSASVIEKNGGNRSTNSQQRDGAPNEAVGQGNSEGIERQFRGVRPTGKPSPRKVY